MKKSATINLRINLSVVFVISATEEDVYGPYLMKTSDIPFCSGVNMNEIWNRKPDPKPVKEKVHNSQGCT